MSVVRLSSSVACFPWYVFLEVRRSKVKFESMSRTTKRRKRAKLAKTLTMQSRVPDAH